MLGAAKFGGIPYINEPFKGSIIDEKASRKAFPSREVQHWSSLYLLNFHLFYRCHKSQGGRTSNPALTLSLASSHHVQYTIIQLRSQAFVTSFQGHCTVLYCFWAHRGEWYLHIKSLFLVGGLFCLFSSNHGVRYNIVLSKNMLRV